VHDDDLGFEEVYDPETIAMLDAWQDTVDDVTPMLPSRLSRWGRGAAFGMVLSGVALGLQEVFDPKEQHQIVVEVDDAGLTPHLPIELFLDPDSPAGSLCVVRRTNPAPPTV